MDIPAALLLIIYYAHPRIMSAEEVKILHEAIKLDRMSAEVWAWFTPEEWEMIDSL